MSHDFDTKNWETNKYIFWTLDAFHINNLHVKMYILHIIKQM